MSNHASLGGGVDTQVRQRYLRYCVYLCILVAVSITGRTVLVCLGRKGGGNIPGILRPGEVRLVKDSLTSEDHQEILPLPGITMPAYMLQARSTRKETIDTNSFSLCIYNAMDTLGDGVDGWTWTRTSPPPSKTLDHTNRFTAPPVGLVGFSHSDVRRGTCCCPCPAAPMSEVDNSAKLPTR